MARMQPDARSAPAALRNRDPILGVLRRVLPERGRILELASGTGEHAVHFARAFPGLEWQPSEPDPAMRASIAAHAETAGLANLRAPAALDLAAPEWWTALPPGTQPLAAVVAINLVHIAPWRVTVALFEGGAQILRGGGIVVLYGPYNVGGAYTADSNEAFDRDLRARNPEWGLRDVFEVAQLAADLGFELAETVDMPANNKSLIFRRRVAKTKDWPEF
jgi:Protein of unknown function (DUF938)